MPVFGVAPAGRLDYDSEGLMLLTDDGALAHRLTHPRYHLPKTYFVQVEQIPPEAALRALRQGVLVKGELTAPAEVDLLPRRAGVPARAIPVSVPASVPTAWLKLILREGRKRQIRHMTAAVGHPALRLVRVAIGPLTLRGLVPGKSRDMLPDELSRSAGLKIGGIASIIPGKSQALDRDDSHKARRCDKEAEISVDIRLFDRLIGSGRRERSWRNTPMCSSAISSPRPKAWRFASNILTPVSGDAIIEYGYNYVGASLTTIPGRTAPGNLADILPRKITLDHAERG